MNNKLIQSQQISIPYLNVEWFCHKAEQMLFVFNNPRLKANLMCELNLCYRRTILRSKRENKQTITEACKWLSDTLDHLTGDWMKKHYSQEKHTVV